MKQPIEILPRLLGSAPGHRAFHEIPQSVCVEHESRARHDVRPVAGFILLEQKEALMFLRRQPSNRELDAPWRTSAAIHRDDSPIQQCQRNQPPQASNRCIPDTRSRPPAFADRRTWESVRLALGAAPGCRGPRSRALQRPISGQRHPDGTNSGIAPEYGRIAALFCARGGGRREHTAARRDFLSRARSSAHGRHRSTMGGIGLSRGTAHRQHDSAAIHRTLLHACKVRNGIIWRDGDPSYGLMRRNGAVLFRSAPGNVPPALSQ